MSKFTSSLSWHDIDWVKAQSHVNYIQHQLVVAEAEKDNRKIMVIQGNLVNSWSGRSLAVRAITTNKGKNTPGIDKEIWDTSIKKMDAIERLGNTTNYVCLPVKRVYIPKAGGRLRSLGIPTMYDRALQYLWKLALDPIAESRGDRHSYGFRRGRSTQDVQTFLHLLLSPKSRCNWVLEADIKGFFDNIDHNWIIRNIPMDKSILLQWLKAGAIELPSREIQTISADVPQGGPISPLIANMALDGLQRHVIGSASKLRKKSRTTSWSPKVNVIRYADDFIVTAATKRILGNIVKPSIEGFLSVRGLELNLEKTHITSVKKGFDFVGFHFRIYPHKNGPNGYTSLVKPTKSGIKRLRSKISDAIVHQRSSGHVISVLNPILRGWANYYKACSAKKVYTSLVKYLWDKTWIWAKRKHRNLNFRDLAEKYYTRRGKRKWIYKGVWMGKVMTLFQMDRVLIKRHSLARDLNPYLQGNTNYFTRRFKRLSTETLWGKERFLLLKDQKYICPVCHTSIKGGSQVDVHHIKPKKLGGGEDKANKVILHRKCHVQVTNTKSSRLLARFRRENILEDE